MITENSKGKPIHDTSSGIENFWKWFGESKIVDYKGRPLVLYHGTNEPREALEGSFFTDSKDDAFAYGELKAVAKEIEDNGELDEIIGDIMAEEDAEALTDLGVDRLKEIVEANGFELVDSVDSVVVIEAYIKALNPLDLTDFGSDVGGVSKLWDELHERGLIEGEKWDELEEDARQEMKYDYSGLALYRFLEDEGIQAKAFEKGFDAVVFEDMALDGGRSHTTWLVKDGSQIKSLENSGSFDSNSNMLRNPGKRKRKGVN